MNLIGQLAGYGECERLRKVPAASGFRIRGIEFTREELERAMLEHRRQHNIFEVGDICKISTKHDYGLYKFLRTRDDRIYLEDRLGFAEFGIASSSVYHATPEEIAAGRRL